MMKRIQIPFLLLIIVLIYYKSLYNGFLIGWDDGWQVMNRYTETAGWEGFISIFTEYYKGQYSPLNAWLYSVIYSVWGYNPFVFHLFSLLLHMGSTYLVFSILTVLGVKNKISWWVALLFAIHPLQVESVAWISASKIIVYAFFYLAAMRLYLAYLSKENLGYYIAALLLFILSFGGKEQAVTLPVCLLWIDWVRRRDFRKWQLWQEKIPFFILALFFSWITMKSHASTGNGMLSGQTFYPLIHRLVFGAYTYLEYIIKTIFPYNLLYIYPFPMPKGDPLPIRLWIYPLALLVLSAGVLVLYRRKVLLYALAFYTIHIALTIQVVPMSRSAIIADRYIYLALPALLFIFLYYGEQWLRKQKDLIRKAVYGIFIVYCLLLGYLSYQRTLVWKDNDTLKKEIREIVNKSEKKETE